MAEMVVSARARMTTSAARHPRFSGLSEHDVEELFDATSEILVGRADRFENADHVRASLWTGMELRARDVFRRRQRRGFELDNDALDLLPDDLADHEDRISHEQELLVVRDFLAAMTPREAEVWKLVHGEELSVAQTSRQLGISRHATAEHLEAAGRKLEVFLGIRRAGEWCGRRESDILRMLGGSDDEGTARRAMAHLDACAVCRRAYAAQVRRTGRLAAGVLPLPGAAAGEHGRTLVERLADLVPFGGGGGGRTEMVGSAILGGGGLAGVAKVGAVVATTATVAVGAGTVAGGGEDRAASSSRPTITAVARPAVAVSAATPAPAVIRRASEEQQQAPVRRERARERAAEQRAERSAERAAARQRAAERREDVFELGTVESGGAPSASSASSAPAPSGGTSSGGGSTAPAAPDPAGQEAFLP
ncbi:hypothetical protein GKE82_18510 [Conexibacter sp. W3-3-2]|uniref:RNA polymerase sigma factor n=1 Tax=Conexibacter sp. W3-3-2 TaxID=2675227 RepID=UPI0012B765CB|nr:sigma-70 family RNA polymerase sigma factor [Conexibacter sp. W3-3-2]MTD46225.1 hypothetical protein [Conexibacter sp. W3-3-2]